MNINKKILDAALQHIPLTPEDLKHMDAVNAVGLAALALAGDPATLDAWYKALLKKSKPSKVEAFISLLVERDEVGENIDHRLAKGDFQVLNDLVRLGVPWEHPELPEALKSEDACDAAVITLVEQEEYETVTEWLANHEDVEVFRTLSLLGVPIVEFVMEQREQTDEESEERAVLDAALLGMLEPEGYGKLLLSGDLESNWTAYPRLLADVLTLCGPNSWVETLGLLEAAGDLDAFAFAGILAAGVSSLTLGLEQGQDIVEPNTLEHFQTDKRFAVAAGIAPDEDILELVHFAVVHECRLANDQPSPGIPGLPLSSSDPAPEDLNDLIELCGDFIDEGSDDPVKRVAMVRNLMDASLWAVDEPEFVKSLENAAKQLLNAEMPTSVRGAAYQFLHTLGVAPAMPEDFNPTLAALVGDEDLQSLSKVALDEGVAAMSALRHMADLGTVESVEALLNVWTEIPILRADLLRTILFDAIELQSA